METTGLATSSASFMNHEYTQTIWLGGGMTIICQRCLYQKYCLTCSLFSFRCFLCFAEGPLVKLDPPAVPDCWTPLGLLEEGPAINNTQKLYKNWLIKCDGGGGGGKHNQTDGFENNSEHKLVRAHMSSVILISRGETLVSINQVYNQQRQQQVIVSVILTNDAFLMINGTHIYLNLSKCPCDEII